MLRVVEKTWNDFWATYWRLEHRHSIPGIFEWDCRLVNFIEHVCELTPGQRVLDLGCGGGDQAKVFAQKGYDIVGIDIAPSLVEFAQRQFKKERLQGTFIVGDMRDINYDAEFDVCVLLSGTFGFFGDVEDQKLLQSIYRALKPGGKVFIMFLSTDRLGKRTRSWREIEDGWELSESWFDAETSTAQSRIWIIRKDGTIIRPRQESGYHANEVIRCYTVPEMRAMLATAGLRYLASFSNKDFTGPPQPPEPDAFRNIVVAARLIT